MNVLVLLLFVGVFVVALALGFFAFTVRSGALDHADRLSLLPLRDDEKAPRNEPTATRRP